MRLLRFTEHIGGCEPRTSIPESLHARVHVTLRHVLAGSFQILRVHHDYKSKSSTAGRLISGQ
jgi:hypothetical protein